MRQKGASALGQAKPQPFGAVLRQAIKEEFGSGKEFARAACKSEGRVSQVVRGPEAPDAATLAWVLETFQSLKLRGQVRDAWVRDFASAGIDPREPVEVGTAIGEINGLADHDPRLALRFAEEVRARLTDAREWQEATERVVHLRLRLSSPGTAALVVDEMERRARAREDPTDLLTALWMRGNALRNLENVSARALHRAHSKATEFAAAFRPSDAVRRSVWLNRRAQMDRDFALHVLTLHDRKPLEKEGLLSALKSVERSIQDGDSPAFTTMGLEVRARVELALGWVVKAEDTLDEILALASADGTELQEKTALTKAKILLARSQKEAALDRLVKVATYCLEKTNLHHHRVAEQLILRIQEGP